jgi:peptidoglycan hydrolase-like amidase
LRRALIIAGLTCALLGVVRADSPGRKPTVRIGVFGLFHPQSLVVQSTGNDPIFVYAAKGVVELGRGEQMECRRSGQELRCRKGEESFRVNSLMVGDRSGGPVTFVLSVPRRLQRRYTGTLEIGVGTIKGRRALQPVVTMDRELAVAAAVKAESPPGAPIEALKAQAVVTRSYFSSPQNRHSDFDFCDTTHCQFVREVPRERDPAMVATRATQGSVLFYQHAVLPALYSADCGGSTKSLEEIGVRTEGYPYYAVADAYCARTSKRWQARLDGSGSDGEAIKAHSERARLAVGRKRGWSAVPGTNYSAREEDGGLVLEGSGKGHGVGLCQHGAAELAREGKSWREILAHYYPNTSVGEVD